MLVRVIPESNNDLITIGFMINNVCGHGCQYCITDQLMTPKHIQSSINIIDKVIEFASYLKQNTGKRINYYLMGGDPLVNLEILKHFLSNISIDDQVIILSHLNYKQAHIQKVLDLTKNVKYSINPSIHVLNSNFSKTIKNIKTNLKLFKENGKLTQLQILVNSNITKATKKIYIGMFSEYEDILTFYPIIYSQKETYSEIEKGKDFSLFEDKMDSATFSYSNLPSIIQSRFFLYQPKNSTLGMKCQITNDYIFDIDGNSFNCGNDIYNYEYENGFERFDSNRKNLFRDEFKDLIHTDIICPFKYCICNRIPNLVKI